MRTLILAVLSIVCALTLTTIQTPATAWAATPPGTVSVTGEAEVRVAPDQVVLILGVETWDTNMQVAKQQNDARVKRVIGVTKDFGVEPRYVQTDQINIEPRYEGAYGKSNFIGFFVRKTIVITLKDLTRFEDLYTAALGAGATHVQGIQFRTTELRKYRDQARTLAIQAAKEKSSALAGELGRQIGAPQSIHEEYSGWSSWYASRWGGGMTQNIVQNVGGGVPNEQGTFAPGQISVSARVSVTFALE